MVSDCFTELKDRLKDKISESDLKKIYKDLEQETKAKQQNKKIPFRDALKMTSDEIVEHMENQMKVNEGNVYREALLRVQAKDYLKRFPDYAKGIDAYMNGIQTNVAGSRDSVAAHIYLRHSVALGHLLRDLLENPDVYNFFNDAKNDIDIAKERFEIGSSGNEMARKTAEIFDKHTKILLNAMRALGVPIHEASDFIASLNHNGSAMQSATGNAWKDLALKTKMLVMDFKGDYEAMNEKYKDMAFDRWKKHIVPLLNLDKTLENVAEKDTDQFFKNFYDVATTGISRKGFDENVVKTRTGTPMTTKLSMKRTAIFKDGESFAKYNSHYGYHTMHDALIVQLEKGWRGIALMEKFGNNPGKFVNDLVDFAKKQSRGISGADRHIKHAIWGAKYYLRQYDSDTAGLAGHILRTMKGWVNLTGLGDVTLHSFDDAASMTSAMSQFGMGSLKVYSNVLKNLTQGMSRTGAKEIAMAANLYGKGTLGAMFDRWGGTYGYGNFAKGMRLADQLRLITPWDSTLRGTMGQMLGNILSKHIDLDWSDMSEKEQRAFMISNIGEKEWKFFKANKDAMPVINNFKYMVPDMMDDVSEASLKEYVGENATSWKINKAREHLRDSLQLFFNDQTLTGKVMPDESDIALMRMGVDPNTPPGMVWSLLTQFKSFSYARTRRVLGRMIYGSGADSFYDAIIHGKADFKGIANWGVQTIGLNYMSMAAVALTAGQVPPNPFQIKTASRLVSPLFGIYGDLLIDNFTSNNDSLAAGISPVLRNVEDVKKLFEMINEGKNPGVMATYMARSNMPVIKTFYTKFPLDHAIWNAFLEHFHPGYLDEYTQKQRDAGKKFLIAPNQFNL